MAKKSDNKISVINRFNIIFVDIQVIFTILVLIFGILYLFNSKMAIYFKSFLILDLLMMAFNNYKIYKRINMTIVYLIVAIGLFICMVI